VVAIKVPGKITHPLTVSARDESREIGILAWASGEPKAEFSFGFNRTRPLGRTRPKARVVSNSEQLRFKNSDIIEAGCPQMFDPIPPSFAEQSQTLDRLKDEMEQMKSLYDSARDAYELAKKRYEDPSEPLRSKMVMRDFTRERYKYALRRFNMFVLSGWSRHGGPDVEDPRDAGDNQIKNVV